VLTFIPSHAEKLTDRVTLETVVAVLEHYFDLPADGYVCQTRDVWNILVAAAARCTLFVDGDGVVDWKHLDCFALGVSPATRVRPASRGPVSIHSAVYAPIPTPDR
jgi:hypothetical protein